MVIVGGMLRLLVLGSHHPRGRALLSVLGIALGVALGYGVYLVNRAAVDELAAAVRGLAGEADLEVRGGRGGFPDSLYPAIARLPGVASASPGLELDAGLAGTERTIRLIGIDALRERRPELLTPDKVLLSVAAAELAKGDRLRLIVGHRTVELQVGGVVDLKGVEALTDIATAQWRLERLGAIGGLVGLALGYALALAAVRASGADLGAGVFRGLSPKLDFSLVPAFFYLAAGIAVAAAGALLPALDAARQAPAQALKAGDEQRLFARLSSPWPGLAFILAGAALAQLGPVGGLPIYGYAATGYLEPGFEERVRALPQVARADFLRSGRILLDPSRPPLVLIARDRAEKAFPKVGRQYLRRADDPAAVWISEAVGDLYGFSPGQKIQLPVNGQSITFVVAGAFRDYARQHGSVLIDRADYAALTGDRRVNDAALWLTPGATPAQAMDAIRALPGAAGIDLGTPGEIRQLSLRIFDRSFAVTYALAAGASAVGLC